MGRLINIAGNTVPENTAGALARYFLHHIRPGSFIEAVLRNNLFGAVNQADQYSLQCLGDIVRLVTCYLPMSISGSGYDDWLENDDEEWHEAALRHHGDRWKPYLDM